MGEFASFELLYRRHSGKVYAFLRKRLDRNEDADEVFQAVFTKFHHSRKTYDSAHPFSAWLFVLTKTVLLDHWRKAKITPSRQALPIDEMADLLPSTDSGSMGSIEAASLSDEMFSALGALPQEQRQVLELRVIDQLSYEEIASRIGKSPVNIRQIASRALKRLRVALEPTSRRNE